MEPHANVDDIKKMPRAEVRCPYCDSKVPMHTKLATAKSVAVFNPLDNSGLAPHITKKAYTNSCDVVVTKLNLRLSADSDIAISHTSN